VQWNPTTSFANVQNNRPERYRVTNSSVFFLPRPADPGCVSFGTFLFFLEVVLPFEPAPALGEPEGDTFFTTHSGIGYWPLTVPFSLSSHN
jgi:hypothetical protein